MPVISYHTFYFPFKWELPEKRDALLSQQIDVSNIEAIVGSQWERCPLSDEAPHFDDPAGRACSEAKELFAEQQYYFDFVHPALYDTGSSDNLLHHYERKEPKESEGTVTYHIACKWGEYTLQVDAINLNLYSTGVGVLSFYLSNSLESQKSPEAILNINQFGRRIMPPHAGEFADGEKGRGLLANSLAIEGLIDNGTELGRYNDTFEYYINNKNQLGLANTWTPSHIIKSLIADFNPRLGVVPIIDDRMFVNCVYNNPTICKQIEAVNDYKYSDFWYKYLFVDDQNNKMCQNTKMQQELVDRSTYMRWSGLGGLTGISRYSMVAITNADYIMRHYVTIYSRMFELAIVQRATILRFSGEVTKVSNLKEGAQRDLSERINSLYKEYIRYINQMHFRSVTAQDQGTELYQIMFKEFRCEAMSKELDAEINELYQYVSLRIEKKRSENGERLNLLAAIFLPATLFTGLFGMNPFDDTVWCSLSVQFAIIVVISALAYIGIKKYKS